MHRHTVNCPMCRTKFYQSIFFPCTTALRNSLTNECFPPDYDLIAFKGRVNKFLLLKLPVTLTFSGFGLVMGDLCKIIKYIIVLFSVQLKVRFVQA